MNSVIANLSPLIRISAHNLRPVPLILNSINSKYTHITYRSRTFSTQTPAFESTLKTQKGIFQSISESAPVEYLQNFLVHVHDQYGLPWWATIITTTILFRSCITVPFAVYQQNILAKVENITAEMPAIAKELQKETALAIKLYKWDEKTAKYQYRRSLKKQWNKLIVRDNCHPFKASVLLWFQIPLWISYSMSLRNLVYLLPKGDLDAHIIFTELTVGGFAWIPNLTVVDSSYILPVLLGLLNLANIEMQSLLKTKPPTKFQTYLTYFFRGISFAMIPLAACVPSCLALYWTTSSAYGLVQNLILISPKVKRFCGIPITASELQNPYVHIASNFKNKYANYLKIK